MLKKLLLIFKREPEYVYGRAGPGMTKARRHKTGRVDSVFWKAGQHGHTKDFWHPLHEYWWPTFVIDEEQP